MRPTPDQVDALIEQHRRLRRAARAVVDTANYPAEGDKLRVYRHQLEDLRRELDGVPQPCNRMTWMSPT